METSSGAETFLFTSESVNEGHPDKLCDQISDAVLDACLAADPESVVACEACTKADLVMVFGEISTRASDVNYTSIVRNTCRSVGFTSEESGLDADRCTVLVHIEQQSPEIASAVHASGPPEEVGAGDQGHMFGYATDETPELMPLSHSLATRLGARLAQVRKDGTLPWLRPDGKTQVTVEYRREADGAVVPLRVHTVLVSTQHDETVTNDEIAEGLMRHVVRPVVPEEYLDEQTIFHLNPSGRFVIGGPHGDAGLTGRKIIVDTYGGWGAHGGGAFSGKDPATKVDRSGAYAARRAAKSLVASGLARRCLVQVSYAIGVPEPLSVFVDTYGSGKLPDGKILEIVRNNFDFRPGMIALDLDLKRGGNGRFLKTAVYGHFGREDDPDFTWEVVKPLRWAGTQNNGASPSTEVTVPIPL